MSLHFESDVIIVGGGPVGLLAALDLDARGISSIVIETRAFGEAPNVKCNHVSARTMERFRQLGFSDRVRKAGLPVDHPHDVAFRTSMVSEDFTRIRIPGAQERSFVTEGPDVDWATPEPPHRINQKYLEPILMDEAASRSRISPRWQTEFLDFEQSDDSITVRVRDVATQEISELTCKFLIGADGGRSRVRKQMGVKLQGDAVLQQVQSTCIRAPQLLDLMEGQRAWGYYVYNPRRSGHVYSIDGTGTFLIHNHLSHEEAEMDSVDRDTSIRAILGVDETFEYEVVSEEDWTARRLVADRFRKGRVFIAGDAAHLWVPYAGYGMNAGIADGLNLTWLLAAYLSGWADISILDAYEAERMPITEQVSRFAMSHQRRVTAAQIPDHIEAESEAGELARMQLGEAAYRLNVEQFAASGLNFGYSYSQSPIIQYDGEEPPEYTMGSYQPSTVPGCRAPHFWLSDATSLYDHLGLGYTLLAIGENSRAQEFIDNANSAGLPFSLISLTAHDVPAEYDRAFYIVRDDQHVVWRGESLENSWVELCDQLSGKRSAVVSSRR